MEGQNPTYLPLRWRSSLDGDNRDNGRQLDTTRGSCGPQTSWKNILILSLLLLNLATLLLMSKKVQRMPGLAMTEPLPTKLVRFDWWTDYSSKNDTETDRLWDAINPAHGMVAIEGQYAKQNDWPESMRLPNDGQKRVYLVEAYHLLHCLKIIRTTFWQLERGENLTYHPPHSGHCFDILRQSIQCHADNTLLYTLGKNTAGDRQLRQCRDWDRLRDWATEHTACYRDSVEQIPLNDHFGYCDDGQDGLIDAKRVGE